MKIFISNLSYLTTVKHLRQLFTKFGLIHSVEILREGINGNSSGVGFIKMDKSQGGTAIEELNNMKFMNFYIQVSEVPM
jgi:RNA recognition motif-containing protein